MNRTIVTIVGVFLLGAPYSSCDAMEKEVGQSEIKTSLSDHDLRTSSTNEGTPGGRELKPRKRSATNPVTLQPSKTRSDNTLLKKDRKSEERGFPFPDKITFWEVVFMDENRSDSPLYKNIQEIGRNWIQTQADSLDLEETHNPILFLYKIEKLKRKSSRGSKPSNSLLKVKFVYMLPIIWRGCCYDDTFSIEECITRQKYEEIKIRLENANQIAEHLHWRRDEGERLEKILDLINVGKPLLSTPHEIIEKKRPATFLSNPDLFKALHRSNSGSGIIIRGRAFTNNQVGDIADHLELSSSKQITLTDSPLRLPGIRLLKPHISLSDSITKLVISGQSLGDLSALLLLNNLPYVLEELDLSHTLISDVTLIGLSSIRRNNQVKSLSLNSTSIGGKNGLFYLFCRSSFAPEHVSLGGNIRIEDSDFSAPTGSFQQKLRSLDLSNTSIGDGAISVLMAATSLELLLIHNAKITETAAKTLTTHGFIFYPTSTITEDVDRKIQNGNWYRKMVS
jgi:hypothetical protein